ncbi:MAG: threonylcarbamoyl-AMP synthase [Lachnospiraceae bacterium]|nr:threonylcarbamoyl-AMP synthase [Lachnospiraceae bacterium]
MNTVFKTITENEDNTAIYEEAGRIIRVGGLVAFPTETVYGLGGDALNKDSSQKIYAAKGRPSDNPLIAHICDIAQLDDLVSDIPSCAGDLAQKFWPGPLTLIMKKKAGVPYETTGGLDTVAVRMPNHPVALDLIRYSQRPIAAPSANLSGRPSPTKASHVLNDLNGRIDMILDGGSVGIGVESTIIDLTGSKPMLLRPGYYITDDFKQILGDVLIDPAVANITSGTLPDENIKPKAPGMKYRHYAPKAELVIVSGEDKKVTEKINELISQKEAAGIKCGVITAGEDPALYPKGLIKDAGSSDEERAASLFAILREFDETDTGFICARDLSEGRLGNALMNRLCKAAAGRIIRV